MPRMYVVTFEGVSVSAAQDLFQISGATGKMLRIKRTIVGATDSAVPTAQMLQFRARFLPATVTNGTGGSAPTPQPLDPGDAAASFTARVNDTTKATSSGTASILYEMGSHVYNQLDENFDIDGRNQTPPAIGPSEAWVFELLSTPTGTLHLSGSCWVEETGG